LPQRKYWSQLDRATFAFGYGLMVTPLQLAHVYATIGGFGLERPSRSPASIPRYRAPRHAGRDCARSGAHDGERCAARRRGVKAAVRDYRVAVKTGTAKKIDDSGKYVDKYVAYTAALRPPAIRVLRWWW
jgi:cell division protein FtsI (penicillin-binding protein 3)